MTRKNSSLLIALVAVVSLVGCRQDMHDQPKYQPFETSRFFEDGRASRPWIEGTVARGHLRSDREMYTGMTSDGELVSTLPIELSRSTLEEGRQLFDAFCSPCHDYVGTGNGMIVQRGFKRPTSFHNQRLRDAPVGYFYDVMSNGFGDMSSYAAQLQPEERWAIAAYIQALQLSQNASVEDLSTEERSRLTETAAVAPTGDGSDSQAAHSEPTAEAEAHESPTSEGGQS